MGMQLVKSDLKVEYAPDAMVYWDRPSRLGSFWKEQYRYGVGMGEADVLRTEAGYRHALGGGKFALYVDALRKVLRQAPRKMLCLVRKGKVAAAFYLPLLIYGNLVSRNAGFAIGFRRGNTECLACRKRLE